MSANTVKRRIKRIADDIENQIIKIVKNSPFYSIQLDESTDVSNKALLLCFVRVECEGELQEELLCSLNLPGRTISFEILKALDSYFLEHGIEWKKSIGIYTDGAAGMTEHRAGVVAKVKMLVTQTLCLRIALYMVSILWRKKCLQNYTKYNQM